MEHDLLSLSITMPVLMFADFNLFFTPFHHLQDKKFCFASLVLVLYASFSKAICYNNILNRLFSTTNCGCCHRFHWLGVTSSRPGTAAKHFKYYAGQQIFGFVYLFSFFDVTLSPVENPLGVNFVSKKFTLLPITIGIYRSENKKNFGG